MTPTHHQLKAARTCLGLAVVCYAFEIVILFMGKIGFEGRHHSGNGFWITKEEHPNIYWSWVILFLFIAMHFTWRGIAALRAYLRYRKRMQESARSI